VALLHLAHSSLEKHSQPSPTSSNEIKVSSAINTIVVILFYFSKVSSSSSLLMSMSFKLLSNVRTLCIIDIQLDCVHYCGGQDRASGMRQIFLFVFADIHGYYYNAFLVTLMRSLLTMSRQETQGERHPDENLTKNVPFHGRTQPRHAYIFSSC